MVQALGRALARVTDQALRQQLVAQLADVLLPQFDEAQELAALLAKAGISRQDMHINRGLLRGAIADGLEL
ncbi:hypothetical protein D3C79_1069210 [compost metagenome]